MKKSATILLSLVLLTVLTFTLVACNNTKTKEYEQFKTVIQNVKKNSLDLLGQQNKTSLELSTMSLTQEQQYGLMGALDSYKHTLNPEELEYIKRYFDTVSEVCFNLPLVAGYALSDYKKESKFYGVVVNVEEQGFYMVSDNSGTNFSSKVLVSMSNDQSQDTFYYFDVNYVSETNFDFVVYEICEDDQGTTCYYGNSNLDFVVLHKQSGFVMFSTTSGGAIVNNNSELVTRCYQYLDAGINAVDKEEMRSYRKHYDYQFSASEWQTSYNKFITGTTAAGTGEFGFEVVNGVITKLKGNIDTCPTELILPSDATAVYYRLELPSKVKKLIIPDNITSVKMERQQLKNYQIGTDDKDYQPYQDLVDCPAKYFSIHVFDSANNNLLLQSVAVQGNSQLFEVDNHCLYTKDGTLVYIPNNSSITKLTLDYAKAGKYILSRDNFANLKLPNLREIDCTVGYDIKSEMMVDLFFEYVYGVQGGTTPNLDLLTLRIDTNRYEFKSLDNIPSDITIDRINLIGMTMRCQANFTALFDFDVNEMHFDQGFESADVHFVDGATVKDIYFESNVTHFEAMSYDNTVKLHIPWTQYEFEYGRKYERMNINEYQYQQFNWDYSTNVHERVLFDGLSVIYEFLPMTDDEPNKVEIAKQFGNIQFHQQGNGCDLMPDHQHAELFGYKGTGSTITVPSEIAGYPIVSFTLSNLATQSFVPTIEGVTKLILPETLLKLELQLDYSNKFYHFDEIVYNGTMEQFSSMFNEWQFNAVYRICDKVTCTDGTLHSYDYEQWQFVDSENSQTQLNIIIDWATWQYEGDYITTLQGELVYNGQNFSQRQDQISGVPTLSLSDSQKKVSLTVWLEVNLDTKTIAIMDAKLRDIEYGEYHIAFELVSKSPYYGELLPKNEPYHLL